MRRGGEQTIRHVHVDNRGGQAVIGGQNAKTAEQCQATGRAGLTTAMLGADPFGSGVPIASGEEQPTKQDARRDESGST